MAEGGDSEEPATGSVLLEGDIPIAVAGSLVSEGPTEMMADEVLFSEVHVHVPAGTADSLFSDDHAETADSRFSDLPTGMSDSLVPRMFSDLPTGMSDSLIPREIQHPAEKLGTLLASHLYEGQTDQFKQQLREVSQNKQLSLKRVINYPIKRYNDRTCVHLAASNGLFECLTKLLQSGGNPNATSSAADLCQTPLHLAAQKGYVHCLEILIEHGADIMAKNSQQNLAQDMVRGKKRCEQVFQNAMSKGPYEQKQKIVVKKKEEGYRTASSYPSFSETTGSIDSQRSQTSTASLKRLKHEIRQASEKLGTLLASRLYEGQTDQFKQQLREVSQNTQLPLKRVINYPIKRYNDRTCVHLAASNGLFECLKELLQSGGNPNATSSVADLYQTPLHLAAQKGYVHCLEILIEHGADIMSRNSHQVLAQDMIRGRKRCEQVFQNAMCKVLIPARSKEHQQRVIDLHSFLRDGKDPTEFYKLYDSLPPNRMDLSTRWTDWDRQTLLYRVCAIQSVGIVEHMLSKSTKQPLHNTSNEYNPIHVTCKNGNTEIARKLLSHSPHLVLLQAGKEKLSPLHIACSNGNIEMVQIILDTMHFLIQSEKELTLDYKDNHGHTPLFYSCIRGHTAIVKLLIEFQAKHSNKVIFDVNSAEPSQSTPLHAAVQSGSIDILKILLHVKGIDLNAKARPAEKTQRHCIHILEKNRHGRIIPAPETMDQGEVCIAPSTAAIPEATSSQCGTSAPRNPFSTPLSKVEEYASGHSHASEDHSSSEVHSKHRSQEQRRRSVLTVFPKRRRKKKPTGRPSSMTGMSSTELGETSIGIFEADYGRLVVLSLGSSGCKSFNELLMTPLAEACAYGNTEIVQLLLQHGAQDDDGLACRISSFLRLPDLAQLVLAHHCTVVVRERESRGVKDTAARLQLHWGSKKLLSLDGSWFCSTSEYFPLQGFEEDDDRDTGYCSIKSLPHMPLRGMPSIAKFNGYNIRVIHVEQNHLQSVPLQMFCLPNVEEIDLSRNQCTRLPDVRGWKCMQLKKLTLSHNQLVSLPTSVWALPALRKLVATDNRLETLLEEQEELKEGMLSETLEHIDFSKNDLIQLPSFLFQLPSLKRAILDHNKLESLPDAVWSSATIQELIINDNHLKCLPKCEPNESHFTDSAYQPPDIVQRSERAPSGIVEVRPRLETSLTKSDRLLTSVRGARPLTIKQDVSLPDAGTDTCEYSSLKKLSIADNALQTIKQDISPPDAGLDTCEYSSLKKLNIANNWLQTFPVGLPCFAPNLTELDVSNNSFKEIDIRFIPQFMIKFTAQSCKIERFGIVLTRTLYSKVRSCLHDETFSHQCLHRKHHCLPNLTSLKLPGNKLKHFQILYDQPFVIGTGNEDHTDKETRFVPTNIVLLYPALEALELTSNNLQGEFNPNIGHQSHLKQIQLDENPELRKLPMEFSYLRKTQRLSELKRNDLPKLIEPPREYMNEEISVNHLLTYMRSRLKESQEYRAIKLFFIGKEGRGKTTLLRGLKDTPDCVIERTIGINIEDWIYPKPKSSFFKSAPKSVHFLAWDFAGQDVYSTAQQYFYSRRSLYLALFRLTDGIQGVEELKPWLRSVQLRAPGCPVIIVGTHLDQVSYEEAKHLKKLALDKYKDISFYPKIVSVEIVSSVKQRGFFATKYIEKLQRVIYDTACHLQVSSDGDTLEYKPDMPQDDPKALFQQKIPVSFLNLQDAIREEIAAYQRQYIESSTKAIPIMDENTFKATFMKHCEDEDELNEAVCFLHMQGILLHFEDPGIYVLDPQWLAKLASAVNPEFLNECSSIQNGSGEIGQLFTQVDIPDSLNEQCIQLLEKFELVLRIGRDRVIVPTLLPDRGSYAPVKSCPSDLTNYKPPLQRFWVTNCIPDGFWPRLICRIASDRQINEVLKGLTNEIQFNPMEGCASFSESHDECATDYLDDWIPWKTGIACTQQERTLVVITQEENKDGEQKLKWIQGSFRIKVHIHVPEWIKLAKEYGEETFSLNYVHSLATSLMVMISQHVKALGSDWFPGMFLTPSSQHGFTTYVPCWKCCAEIKADTEWQPPLLPGGYISNYEKPTYCFIFEESMVPAVEQKGTKCPVHGFMKVAEIAPDLALNEVGRSDLAGSTAKRYQDMHFQDETTSKAFVVKSPCQSLISPQSLPTSFSAKMLALPSLPIGNPEIQVHHLQDPCRQGGVQLSCPPCAYDSEIVSFIDPPEVVMFNSTGGVYRNLLHGIKLIVPEGAVRDGKFLHLQVGLALYGPFVWPKNSSIVSPIVGLCMVQPGNEVIELQKPVEIRIPHYSEVQDYQNLTFLKANHSSDIVTIDGKPKFSLKPFQIQETNGERIHFEPGSAFGTLHTKHFCYLCIAKKYTQNCTEEANFCLMGAMPDPPRKSFELYFCVSYMLDTCMESMQSLFEMKFKGVQFQTLHPWTFNFTGSRQDSSLVIHLASNEPQRFGWVIALQSPEEILASEIDFWNMRLPELKTKQSLGAYPPCFVLRISGASALRSSRLDISFSGGKKDIKVQIPLETEMQLPQTWRWVHALEPWNPYSGQVQFPSALVPLTANPSNGNTGDCPSETDLHNITKVVMAKLKGNYTLLKAYLKIPEDVMAEIEYMYRFELRKKVFQMLKWWSVHSEHPTKENLVKCLIEADQTLCTVENILRISPPTKKAALCSN